MSIEENQLLTRAAEEATARYNGDVDCVTGRQFDDWGYAEAERRAFIAGATFMLAEAERQRS